MYYSVAVRGVTTCWSKARDSSLRGYILDILMSARKGGHHNYLPVSWCEVIDVGEVAGMVGKDDVLPRPLRLFVRNVLCVENRGLVV